MSDEPISIESRFELGDLELQSGNVLPNAHMGFAAYGALIMPCDTDMYFRVADNEAEVAQMPNAELKVIHSIWGHLAGFPGVSPSDDAFVDAALQQLLAK